MTLNNKDEHHLDDLNHYRRQLEYALGVPFSDGNEVTLLQNGDEIFPAMLHAIQNATRTIDFVTFVYWGGHIADQFAEALSERARAGVTVRVLLDSFGAHAMDDRLARQMELAGVALRWFRPISTWRVWRTDKRTHRKVLVCDNQTGFIGGVGIASQWTGDARNEDEWRDTHSQVSGPAILSLRAAFLDNWNEAGSWLFEPAPERGHEPTGTVPIQITKASSTIGLTSMATLMRTLIELAEHKLMITTAYFAPEPVITDLLCAAAQRGVDVQILVPGSQTDSRLSQLAGQKNYSRLMHSGVTLWQYQQTLLHSKLLTVDDYVCCIGSANLNHRSLSKDEECSLVALSSELVRSLEHRFNADCGHAQQIDLDQWQQRGWLERVKEHASRLLIEQL